MNMHYFSFLFILLSFLSTVLLSLQFKVSSIFLSEHFLATNYDYWILIIYHISLIHS